MSAWRTSIFASTGLVAVLAATGITLGVTSGGSGAVSAGPVCERLVVPAYFAPQYWGLAVAAKPPPSVILDISGVGAGDAPQPRFRMLVSRAQAAGVTVLGYSSTVDGQRPIAEVEADVRHYAAWYGVTSIFLDRVSGQSAQVPYYQQLADYVHRAHPGAQVWLNPGVYPDQRYMSIGNVVMVFEGTYAQYQADVVPGWARKYPAARFAHTVYATSQADLANALRLAAGRNAGHVYVTDGTGANPYQALPGYWWAEVAAASAGCKDL
jgi:hypothetical protein